MNNYQHAIIIDTKVLGRVRVHDHGEKRTIERPKHPDLELWLHHTCHEEHATLGVSHVSLVLEGVRNIKGILSKLLPGTIIENAATSTDKKAFVITVNGKSIPVRCSTIRAQKFGSPSDVHKQD